MRTVNPSKQSHFEMPKFTKQWKTLQSRWTLGGVGKEFRKLILSRKLLFYKGLRQI